MTRLRASEEIDRLSRVQRRLLLVAANFGSVTLRGYEVAPALSLRQRGLADISNTGSESVMVPTRHGYDLADLLERGR